MQACGPWSSAQSRGDTPDVWPCLADPDWASYTLGVFICLSCSGIHRNIPHVSKVKSVRLDTWEDVQVEVRLAGCRGSAPDSQRRWHTEQTSFRRKTAVSPRGTSTWPLQTLHWGLAGWGTAKP